jgi:hypothetical protein
MRNQVAAQYKQRLDRLFKVVPVDADELLRSHWSRYMCILVSGFIEVSVAAILGEFANKGAPQIGNYVRARLNRFQNANTERLCVTVSEFSPAWGAAMRKGTEGRIKAAVDSIVNIRNKIAHGEDVGITYATIQSYYKSAIDCIELIENIIDPPKKD